ncbi:YbgA family protein [Clostridiaceae bacterium UIB06]|uniref:YbgA family protein n=1 Tax=Clostridium thailandense TaxID=2794346 RepID=A0A949TMM5_9CLOT|nr:YbgA family protein [Clostridium thailandense]MBV7275175.1 YbgA family protein [Clostridium thailandense]MCH5137843.1 YbgA family protein [Clostridiaceae bacterium UIB06]
MIDKAERKRIEEEWAKYKYCIMERSYKFYKEISKSLSHSNISYEQFIGQINQFMSIKTDKSQILNTIYHVWGYFKKIASEEEKKQVLILINKYKNNQCSEREIKTLLYQYALKYNVTYLINSYYFNK